MNHRLEVLVYLREANAPYRERLIDDETTTYRFCHSEAEVERSIAKADVILGSIQFPARLLPLADRLRWIQVTGAGVDGFLGTTSLPESVILTRADVGFGAQIAEYVIGHLLSLTQRLHQVYAQQEARRWEPLHLERLGGRTLGVVGVGSVGSAIAEAAVGMGLRILGCARTAQNAPPFERVYGPEDLRTFLAELDVLVLACPLTRETRGLIGTGEFRAMKPSAILVNVARGAIVDEEALIAALRSRTIAGAILDVFAREPLPAENPLWAMDRVTVTPHQAGLNVPSEIADFFLLNLARFRRGESMLGVVDRNRGY